MPSSHNQLNLKITRAHVSAWQPDEIAPPLFPPSAPTVQDQLKPAPRKTGFTLAELISVVGIPAGHDQDFMPDAFSRIAVEIPGSQPSAGVNPVVLQSSSTGQAQSWQAPELEPVSAISNMAYSSSASRIITAENRIQADELIRNAAEKADEILRQAQARAEELVTLAESKAYDLFQQAQNSADQVRQHAHQEGLQAASIEMTSQVQVVNAIVDEVRQWRDELFSKGEMMMLRLVIEIAQSIFGDGLPLDPETLGRAFSRALTEAKTLGDLRVYVHPDDAAMLGDHWAAQQTLMSGQRIELVASDIIKRGGCFVEGQYGSVDARVETQFQITRDTLLTTLETADGGSA